MNRMEIIRIENIIDFLFIEEQIDFLYKEGKKEKKIIMY